MVLRKTPPAKRRRPVPRETWASVQGDFTHKGDAIIFQGRAIEHEGKSQPSAGQYISNQTFGGGTISATLRFEEISQSSALQLVLFYEPEIQFLIGAGIIAGQWQMYGISQRTQQGWTHHGSTGGREALVKGREFFLQASLTGSDVQLAANGAVVLKTSLPFSLGQSQAGIWCQNESPIIISGFKVYPQRYRAFVVIPFSQPYEEIYREVTKVVCDEFELDAVTAADTYSSGLIIADVVSQIRESRIVIADVTALNPNVFYEIGFAHAIGKPTILLAQQDTKLPFDISGFRHLLYENTISGKARIEERLRNHLKAEGFTPRVR